MTTEQLNNAIQVSKAISELDDKLKPAQQALAMYGNAERGAYMHEIDMKISFTDHTARNGNSSRTIVALDEVEKDHIKYALLMIAEHRTHKMEELTHQFSKI